MLTLCAAENQSAASAGPPSLPLLHTTRHRASSPVVFTFGERNAHVCPEPEQVTSVLLRDQLNPNIILML